MQRRAQSACNGTYSFQREAIDHLLGVAKSLIRAESAAIAVSQGEVGRVISRLGLVSGSVTFDWNRSEIPYKADAVVIQSDVKNGKILNLTRSVFGLNGEGKYVRIPIINEPSLTAAMLFHVSKSQTVPNSNEISVLKFIGKILAKEISPAIDRFIDSSSTVMITDTYCELISSINSDQGIRALIDSNMNLINWSIGFSKIIRNDQDNVTCDSFEFQSILTNTLTALFARALQSGISTPEIEVPLNLNGYTQTFLLRGTPVRPIDWHSDLIELVLKQVSPRILMAPIHEKHAVSGFEEERSDFSIEPAGQFLCETLVKKKSVRSRGSISYLTIRSWRSAIKEHQIKALRAIKSSPNEIMSRKIGKECSQEIAQLVGTDAFKFVVPVPCGHSKQGQCFSHSLARSIALELKLPVIDAFAHLGQSGVSHPKTNMKRPPMRQIQNVPGPALLVDDVATSGAHLEEAARILKSAGTEVFAFAWIGSD